MNNCIGWPSVYWNQGLWTFVGFLFVCILAVVGCAAIADAPYLQKGRREEIVFGIAALIGAGVVLQFLPSVEHGVRLVPLPPWNYVRWIAKLISVLSWLGLVIGLITCKDLKLSSFALLAAIGLNSLLSFCSVQTDVAARPFAHAQSQAEIAEWERRLEQDQAALVRLRSDKKALVGRIKSLGAASKKELMEHPLGKILVVELAQLSRQTATLEKEIGSIGRMVEEAKSSLRRLEREAIVQRRRLTDEEYSKICHIRRNLSEELSSIGGGTTPESRLQTDESMSELFQNEEK